MPYARFNMAEFSTHDDMRAHAAELQPKINQIFPEIRGFFFVETSETSALTISVYDDQEALMSGAMEVANRLANGPKSLSLIRKAYWKTWSNSYEQQLELESDLQNEAGQSSDFKEGVSAFLQKRDAQFNGQ